ncbi:GNAT family N-acetyltransferase [Clostridium gasigenes]|uniref:GNAT family N-acetyltransferase n=1 Tax=Clostridium gasigenes TaxID=94869 RepID=UPI0016292523|nr:GNAT family N-acetyltransferase [Clostridium gasigenes]MBB6622913.1 GNAT family N-acetyltransferase [Clostridium gasigenes]MBU3087684.1 GNAT family N-acetyltransferase [Clostridium gasigenes]MBU3103993.1 GNAT family N-acetyltransferase [Clostridium gasigenes]MBU3132384.1 GNAT family N-acetyltransferase [Clostridium gasigenes]
MIIREIQQKDNKEVELLIRTCLIEFGGDKPGCAWTDPNLGQFYELYQNKGSKYFVVEENNKIIAGCGIGPLENLENICELQKMYSLKEVRGRGIANELMEISLEFAKKHYSKCYLETFSNMIGANKFYKKNGFIKLEKPLIETEHFACDVWYIKTL